MAYTPLPDGMVVSYGDLTIGKVARTSSSAPPSLDLLNTLMQLSESLAASYRSALAGDPPPEHQGATDAFAVFAPLIAPLQQSLAQHPGLAEQVRQLPRLLQHGDTFRRLLRGFAASANEALAEDELRNETPLTPREIEVLRLASLGMTNERIAAGLSQAGQKVSARTISTHLDNINSKLHTDNRLTAILRATAYGYIGMDSMDLIDHGSGEIQRYRDPMETYGSALQNIPWAPEFAPLGSLALSALFLAVACGDAMRQMSGDAPPNGTLRGAIVSVRSDQSVTPLFGQEQMGAARGIVVAPPAAAKRGFTPGNLFIAHDIHPQHRLNRAAISEFTPTGEYIRTFYGGHDLATRLVGHNSIVFAPDGRLLVTSGWLTDAILAFSDHGDRVERFADGVFMHLAVGPDESLYAVENVPQGRCIHVWARDNEYAVFDGFQKGMPGFESLSLGPGGRIYPVCSDGTTTAIHVYDRNLRFRRFLNVPGHVAAPIAIDAQDRVIVPCANTRDVKIVSTDSSTGTHTMIPLPSGMIPTAVTVAPDATVWICGLTNGE